MTTPNLVSAITLFVASVVWTYSAQAQQKTFDVSIGPELMLKSNWFDPARCDRSAKLSTIALKVGEVVFDVPYKAAETLLPARPPLITASGEADIRMTLPYQTGCPASPFQVVAAQIGSLNAETPAGFIMRETAERSGASSIAQGLAKFRDSGECTPEGSRLLLCSGRQTIGGVL